MDLGNRNEVSRPFAFKVSLRLRHPVIQPGEITRALGLEPRFHRAEVTTSTGETRKDTYWCYTVTQQTVADRDLEDVLLEHLAILEPNASFFVEFDASGGFIEYFVGWFTSHKSGGETLSWELMRRLSNLRIALSFDVYGAE